ncbi:transcriptional regulator [Hasllibacter halocynthiae]|uniref:HTH-type transcriptional regulator n=1 Tax=Hasllibacter halocynthiae TaxID=595589 RepID=A0A2T0X666_9RHOB|nr:GbsR/MarR family transcriptional regulator [Hasllibacter halocynthiae]PRY94417.1 transcriptional regulator [Hasllibacter halocynthiae]
MALSDLERDFVMHFGEMGSRWGIARTVGQIYAVLFLSERPLCADALVQALGVSRSNVSMGLKELESWNLVRRKHVAGDRREYFETPEDIWQIVRTLIAERKKREIDPTLSTLRELELRTPAEGDAHAHARIAALREHIEGMMRFYEELDRLETKSLVRLMKMGRSISHLATAPGRILPLRNKGA